MDVIKFCFREKLSCDSEDFGGCTNQLLQNRRAFISRMLVKWLRGIIFVKFPIITCNVFLFLQLNTIGLYERRVLSKLLWTEVASSRAHQSVVKCDIRNDRVGVSKVQLCRNPNACYSSGVVRSGNLLRETTEREFWVTTWVGSEVMPCPWALPYYQSGSH